ncbi:uncharacterized protein BDFB_002642, partial [Asbolus verrucosus]
MPYGGEALSCSITAPRRRGRPFIGENPPVTLQSVFSLVFVRIISPSCMVLVLAELLPGASAGPYLDDDEGLPSDDDYTENAIDRLLQSAQ